MDSSRELCAAERMTEVFDRASTLNFATVARVQGNLTTTQLRAALGHLPLRHPLLGCALRRETGGRVYFDAGGAAEIPLTEADGAPAEWQLHVQSYLTHRRWADDGARAELTWLRHGPADSTLVLCLHHAVSDGSSGFHVMQDLLAFMAGTLPTDEVLPAPAQREFYPEDHGNWRWKARAAGKLWRSATAGKPFRVQPTGTVSGPGLARVRPLTWQGDALQALVRRARADNATVHGVLSAALAMALSSEASRSPSLQRITHAVDLRRYLRTRTDAADPPEGAVGYYVSSVDTDHKVASGGELGALAAEITAAVRAEKDSHGPLLMAPMLGPLLTRRVKHGGDLPGFRNTIEGKLMGSGFVISNLGRVESLGARSRYGAFEVQSLFFVGAMSVLAPFGASASTFGDTLTLVLGWPSPLMPDEVGDRLVERTRQLIQQYLGLAAEERGIK